VITVIAGVNGAGKSSIVGSAITARGGRYYNPDEIARKLRENEGLGDVEANEKAWHLGRDLLEQAIASKMDYTFETTLGGNTITSMLLAAGRSGVSIRVFYCGLSSPELHMARVAARVARGGHPIPDDMIRQRWSSSVFNMMQLIPFCEAVAVWDNSQTCSSGKPQPVKVFSFENGVFDRDGIPSPGAPDWAKPLVSAALRAGVVLPKD